MRIAVISDIHGNLPALDAVLADTDLEYLLETVEPAGSRAARPQEVAARCASTPAASAFRPMTTTTWLFTSTRPDRPMRAMRCASARRRAGPWRMSPYPTTGTPPVPGPPGRARRTGRAGWPPAMLETWTGGADKAPARRGSE